jgi:two-component system sensor histidine kinase BaeS
MRTLRGRLILSHILPLLLVVPLVGVTLIYILETQVLLTSLSDELVRHGVLTADMARSQPAIWSDSGEALRFVTFYGTRSRSQVMLFDADGNLLASSEPVNTQGIRQLPDLPNLPAALAGEQQVHVKYTQNLHTEVVQVLVPVVGPNQQIMGVVRMSQHLSDLRHQFTSLRYLILGALAAELLLGVIVGLVLALNLGHSLRRVTEAIYGVASGRQWQTLPEQDPEEIRLLLRAFNTLIERLRLLEESRRHLLANLVHELGRPLGALQSALQALLGGADEDPALRRELLDGMNDQVQRMGPLVESLADLHGQVLGTLELNAQPVALSDWLPRTVTPWRQAAHDKGLHWRTDIPGTLPVVEIDPDRMAQVLGNLLSNAIKYTPEGMVSVEASAQDGGVAIIVSDTGIGIAPSEQARIFEPFYRSRRDKRFPQGMGLGLSIARDLVTAHGGELRVESTPGEGSRFTLWLPQATTVGPVDGE